MSEKIMSVLNAGAEAVRHDNQEIRQTAMGIFAVEDPKSPLSLQEALGTTIDMKTRFAIQRIAKAELTSEADKDALVSELCDVLGLSSQDQLVQPQIEEIEFYANHRFKHNGMEARKWEVGAKNRVKAKNIALGQLDQEVEGCDTALPRLESHGETPNACDVGATNAFNYLQALQNQGEI